MADLNKIVDDLSSLTVLEAAELSKLLEEKWGVSAAAPVAVAAAPAAGAGDAPAEEKSEFDVVLESSLKPYDFIASAAVISGAGGKLTDWNGDDLNLKSDGRIIAAGDAKIHNQLIKVIKKIK